MLDATPPEQFPDPAGQEEGEGSTPALPAAPQPGTPQRAPGWGGDAEVVQVVTVQDGYVENIIGKVVHQHYATHSPAERAQHLALARSRHSQERFAELRQGFVGRQDELRAIAAEVDTLRQSGGYLLITGVAGQGKSSVLAALIAAHDPETTPAYFIRFSPGADEQVALLRHLVATLLTQHGLEELADGYLSETAGAITLANSLAMVLDRVSGDGKQTTLVIDGLDQIRPDRQMGERDLSFIPEKLPAGVVIVIGTRPDDTLKPLKVLASQREYKLPPLSLADFAALLDEREARLTTHERLTLYEALHGNAFDLAFVAREIAATTAADVPALLERVRQNPQDIFAPALDRLKNEPLWRRAIRPILGCLLAATGSEPLSEDALGAILGLDTDEVGDGLLRLRGFLGETDRGGRAYFYLYHLKLIDYLKGAQAGSGGRIFSARDIEQWHGRLVAWCEGSQGDIGVIWQDTKGDALEQERRVYARQHYIAHLAAARSYERLWEAIDSGTYGRAKRQYDPSTRSYALDLDIARQTMDDEATSNSDVQARALPRLWCYSLLRCSLTNQADNYPEELFLALVALGRSGEAINLAELLSDPMQKAKMLRIIGTGLLRQGSNDGFLVTQRARVVAGTIADGRLRTTALCGLAEAMAQVQHPAATNEFAEARTTADAIADDWSRAGALRELAFALAQAQRWEEARVTADAIADDWSRAGALRDLAVALAQEQHLAAAAMFAEARVAIDAVEGDKSRADALSSLAIALTQAQHPAAVTTFAEARATANAVTHDGMRTKALRGLAIALAQAQRWEEAWDTINIIEGAWYRADALSSLAVTLAQAQHWEEARATADAIADDWRRAGALTSLVVALAQAQHWEEARATADAIADDKSRADALSSLAVALAQTEHPAAAATFSAARATAAAATHIRSRAEALSSLAVALAQAEHPAAEATFAAARATAAAIVDDWGHAKALNGLLAALVQTQHPVATAALTETHAIAATIVNDEGRAESLNTLIITLAHAARWEEARATADAILEDGSRATALRELATILAQAQRWEEARATANAIADDVRRAEALRELATILAQAQRWEEARATANAIADDVRRAEALRELAEVLAQAQHLAVMDAFTEARTTADAIADGWSRAEALRELAVTLAQALCWEEARATADAIADDRSRAEALCELAVALTQAEHAAAAATFAEARATIDAIEGPRRRADASSSLVVALAKAQHWEEAHSTANAIANDRDRAEALGTLTTALAQAQRWGEARTTIDVIADGGSRAEALRELAVALTQAQHPAALATFAEARATADTIADGWSRAKALNSLSTSLAQAQHWEEARATANAIADDRSRAEALSALAKTLTDAQQWNPARATADAIADGEIRTEALRALAQALAQAGMLPQAVELLANLWRRAQTRDELLALFVVPPELISAYPELGQAFLDSFAWVDAQLAVG